MYVTVQIVDALDQQFTLLDGDSGVQAPSFCGLAVPEVSGSLAFS